MLLGYTIHQSTDKHLDRRWSYGKAVPSCFLQISFRIFNDGVMEYKSEVYNLLWAGSG